MNTKLLMTTSAIIMALLGIFASFLPQEILISVHADPTGLLPLVVQILGAIYLAFAMMNWMTRSNIIGGIYSRPIAMGNFIHFAIGGIALMKGAFGNSQLVVVWVACSMYSLLALSFGLVLFNHPIPVEKEK